MRVNTAPFTLMVQFRMECLATRTNGSRAYARLGRLPALITGRRWRQNGHTLRVYPRALYRTRAHARRTKMSIVGSDNQLQADVLAVTEAFNRLPIAWLLQYSDGEKTMSGQAKWPLI